MSRERRLVGTVEGEVHTGASELDLSDYGPEDELEHIELVLRRVVDELRQQGDEVLDVQRVEYGVDEPVARYDDFVRLPGEWIEDGGPARLRVEEGGGVEELRLEIGVGAAAGGARRALVEEGLQGPIGIRNDGGVEVHVEREGRVEDDAPNALRVVAHRRQREPRPIGHAVQVPLRYAQGHSQVSHVRGVLGSVVPGDVHALADESLPAGPQGIDVEGLFLLHGEMLVEVVEDGLRILRAVEDGFRGPDAALIEHDHVALCEEGREQGELVWGGLDDAGAGASREVQERIGLGIA